MFVQAHCDAKVLHAPGICEYCDMYPEAQQWRIDEGINFTGQSDPNKKPCPAQEARSLKNINAWGGNQPKGVRTINQQQYYDSIESPSSKMMYGFPAFYHDEEYIDGSETSQSTFESTTPPIHPKSLTGRLRSLWDRYRSRGR